MDIMHEQTVFFEPFLLPSLHPPISVQKYILKKKKRNSHAGNRTRGIAVKERSVTDYTTWEIFDEKESQLCGVVASIIKHMATGFT
jgi:hypothetical protein